MKKIILLPILIVSFLNVHAQFLSTLNENFNTTCPNGWHRPNDQLWYEISPMTPAPSSAIRWNCSSTDGRNGTGGIECTGYYNSVNNLDTDYLMTPSLDLHNYTGSIYIQFDTKTTIFNSSGSIAIYKATDSGAVNKTSVTPTPLFTNGDASDWVTHQVDLTPYKSQVPLYIAFRYTSTTAFSSIWYLDNVLLTTTPLNIPVISHDKTLMPLTVLGNSSSETIILSFNVKEEGPYKLAVYDMIGREVYKQTINTQNGPSTYAISGLNLHSGMYFIKMGNGNYYGTTKTVVQ